VVMSFMHWFSKSANWHASRIKGLVFLLSKFLISVGLWRGGRISESGR